MAARTEAEIDSDILCHDARNLQLKRRLAEQASISGGNAKSYVTSGLLTSGRPLPWSKHLLRMDF